MKEQNSILDKGISLWWEKLRDDIKQLPDKSMLATSDTNNLPLSDSNTIDG